MLAPSLAAQVQVWPIPVELTPGLQASRLTVRNTGQRMLAIQVRVVAWRQVDGEEFLEETASVAVSPAIVEIAPQQEQVVRVLRLGDPPLERDASYRVVLDEIPLPQADAQPGAVSLRLQVLVPLFDRSPLSGEPQLACALEANAPSLLCRNGGQRPARLAQTRLRRGDAGQEYTLSTGLLGYVLPHSSRRFALPAGDYVPGADWQLLTRINGSDQRIELGNAR